VAEGRKAEMIVNLFLLSLHFFSTEIEAELPKFQNSDHLFEDRVSNGFLADFFAFS